MQQLYNLFVPAEYTFKSHFVPKIKDPILDCFEVDGSRQGIQRKGNNHLVVFLDFCLKAPPEKFLEVAKNENYDFHFKTPPDVELFMRVFGQQKEVALFSLSFNPRMTVLAWRLLIEIADDDKTLVEDEGGHLRTGPDCVRELRELMV